MRVDSSDINKTVGTTSEVISEAKVIKSVERISITLVNVSTGGQKISVSTSGEAVADSGLVLSPGGHTSWTKKSVFPIIQSRITAISDLAGGSLAVHEEVLQHD